jgi:hypothetical protein
MLCKPSWQISLLTFYLARIKVGPVIAIQTRYLLRISVLRLLDNRRSTDFKAIHERSRNKNAMVSSADPILADCFQAQR